MIADAIFNYIKKNWGYAPLRFYEIIFARGAFVKGGVVA